MPESKLKLYKAVVSLNGEFEEVPLWAETLDDALDQAEMAYGEVDRIRLAVTHE